MNLSTFLAIAVLVVLPASAALPQAATPATPPSAEVIAQRRAEQALPRTAVAFDPQAFDRYVGFYQLTPRMILALTREGDHFFVRPTGQQNVEIFPESATKFFLK